jgi:hypothetical protein
MLSDRRVTRTLEVSHARAAHAPPVLCGIGPFPPDDLFCGAPRSEAAFGGATGMARCPACTTSELDHIRDLIKTHLIGNARVLSARTASAIAELPIDQYHRAVTDEEHAQLLSKRNRILSAEAVADIKQMSMFDYLRRAFGAFYLSDEENIGREQICFRVALPNRRSDVGFVHRDAWFWDHLGFPVPPGTARTKLWMPVCLSPGTAALLLAPGSHQSENGYRVERIDGKLAFMPRADLGAGGLHAYMGRPGDPILFNYDLLHVGAVTQGDTCRVSIEITLMFDAQRA